MWIVVTVLAVAAILAVCLLGKTRNQDDKGEW